jgi:hypothetical protein
MIRKRSKQAPIVAGNGGASQSPPSAVPVDLAGAATIPTAGARYVVAVCLECKRSLVVSPARAVGGFVCRQCRDEEDCE